MSISLFRHGRDGSGIGELKGYLPALLEDVRGYLREAPCTDLFFTYVEVEPEV